MFNSKYCMCSIRAFLVMISYQIKYSLNILCPYPYVHKSNHGFTIKDCSYFYINHHCSNEMSISKIHVYLIESLLY